MANVMDAGGGGSSGMDPRIQALVAQGYTPQQAASVLQQMLSQPGNPAIMQRLQDLWGALNTPGHQPSATDAPLAGLPNPLLRNSPPMPGGPTGNPQTQMGMIPPADMPGVPSQWSSPGPSAAPPPPQASDQQAASAPPSSSGAPSDNSPSPSDKGGPGGPGGPGGAGAPGGAGPSQPAQAGDPAQSGPQGSGPYGATDAQKQANFYEFNPDTDNISSYGSRVFKGGGPDSGISGFGGNNFYDEKLTGSPWGQWLMSRYAPEVSSDIVLGRLGGALPDDTAGSQMGFDRNVLQNAASGGATPGAAGLKNMASQLSSFDPNNTTGMNQAQADTLRQLYNDPTSQAQTMLGQLRGMTGGWGMNFLQNQLANQTQLFKNNPAANAPNTFASRVMPMVGLG